MNAKERAGRRLYFLLATLFILEKLASVAIMLTWTPLGEVNWLKSVIQPLALAVGIALLYHGDNTLRWLAGGGSIFEGGITAWLMGFLLWALYVRTPPDKMEVFQMLAVPFGFVLVLGVLHIVMGLMILWWPSLQAFFRYQREGAQAYVGSEETTRRGRMPSELADRRHGDQPFGGLCPCST